MAAAVGGRTGRRLVGLGTDNHGQLNDTYLAAGLQIVGQFDYQKSEELARSPTASPRPWPTTSPPSRSPSPVRRRRQGTTYAGGYRWGTLYDILGYSACGSGIDYYNTPGRGEGSGFATELTVGQADGANRFTLLPRPQPGLGRLDPSDQLTMFRRRWPTAAASSLFELGADVAYLFDPERITQRRRERPSATTSPGNPGGLGLAPYDVSRMAFFEDLGDHADGPVDTRAGRRRDHADLSTSTSSTRWSWPTTPCRSPSSDEDAWWATLRCTRPRTGATSS